MGWYWNNYKDNEMCQRFDELNDTVNLINLMAEVKYTLALFENSTYFTWELYLSIEFCPIIIK